MSRYKTKSVLIYVNEPSRSSGMISGVQSVAVSRSAPLKIRVPHQSWYRGKLLSVVFFVFVMHHKVQELDGLGF